MGCGGCGGGGCGTGVELPVGVVSEIVMADDADAEAVAEDAAPSRRWPGLDAGGLDQVKLAILWAILSGGELRDALVEAFTPLAEVSADGPWVFRVPSDLVAALAGLEAGRAGTVAAAWSGAEELQLEDRDPDDVRRLLDGLRGVARAAQAARKPLLMRVSL
jgi:hypothetical protein